MLFLSHLSMKTILFLPTQRQPYVNGHCFAWYRTGLTLGVPVLSKHAEGKLRLLAGTGTVPVKEVFMDVHGGRRDERFDLAKRLAGDNRTFLSSDREGDAEW